MIIRPDKSLLMEKWFYRYTLHFLKRNFHSIHSVGAPDEPKRDPGVPLIVCLNHSSWWDVLLGFYLSGGWIPGEAFGVMDGRQLARYRIFTRLGMIGVDRSNLTGAREFVDFSAQLLKGTGRALWLTPQGEMLSCHSRPVHFQPGLGHLAARIGDFYITTIALHYEFWNERLPEAFVSFSPLTRIYAGSPGFERRIFVTEQEQRLETQLDSLLSLVEMREAGAFKPLLRGKSGINPLYDGVRYLSARLQGKRYQAEHESLITPRWKERR